MRLNLLLQLLCPSAPGKHCPSGRSCCCEKPVEKAGVRVKLLLLLLLFQAVKNTGAPSRLIPFIAFPPSFSKGLSEVCASLKASKLYR